METHFARYYCAETEPFFTQAHVARASAGALALLFGVVLRRRLARPLAKLTLRNSLPTLVAVILSLVVTELILTSRERRREAADAAAAVNRPRTDPTRPIIAGRQITSLIDADGKRIREAGEVTDFHAPTVLWFGESVAVGYGLEYDESPSAQLQAKLGMPVANFAVNGSSNDEQLGRLRQVLPRFEKPVAVVFFVVYTWAARNVSWYRSHLALDKRGNLTEVGLFPLRDSPLVKLGYSIVPYHSDDLVDVTRALFREQARLVKERGAFPLFVFTQCGAVCLRPDFKDALTNGLEAKWIEVYFHPYRDSLPNDMHPSPQGAALYATAIEKALREAEVVPGSMATP